MTTFKEKLNIACSAYDDAQWNPDQGTAEDRFFAEANDYEYNKGEYELIAEHAYCYMENGHTVDEAIILTLEVLEERS